MKTLKITTNNEILIVDVDLNDYKSIQKELGGYAEGVLTGVMHEYFKTSVLMLVDEEGLIKKPSNQCGGISFLWLPDSWAGHSRGCDLCNITW